MTLRVHTRSAFHRYETMSQESQPRNFDILPSKIDKAASSKALVLNGQGKNNNDEGKSSINASKLLGNFSQESKQISAVANDNITFKPGSVPVADRNKSANDSSKETVINVKSGKVFNYTHPSTKTVTYAPQQIGNARMAQECRPQLRKLSLTCYDRSSLTAGDSSTDVKKSDVAMVPVTAINNSQQTGAHSSFITTDASKTVRVVVREGQLPSLFKIRPVGYTSEITHYSKGVFGNSSSFSEIKAEPIPQPSDDRRLAPLTSSSQNFSNLASVNSSIVHPFYVQSRSKASSAIYEVAGPNALLYQSPALSLTKNKSGEDKSKSGMASLKGNAEKQQIMSPSQSCSSLLSTPSSPSFTSGAILCQIAPKQQQFSKAKLQPSVSKIRKTSDSTTPTPTTQQSSLPNLAPQVSLLPNDYVMRTNSAHTGSGIYLSPRASPYYSLPFPTGLKTVLASGTAQIVDENKPHNSLPNTTKCSSTFSQVSSQIVSKNTVLSHASAVAVEALPATSSFTESNQVVGVDMTQLPVLPVCTLISFQPGSSFLSEHSTETLPRVESSHGVQFITPNTIKAANSQIVERENEHSTLLHTTIGDAHTVNSRATKTSSLVVKNSERLLTRPIEPKLTANVLPLHIFSKQKPKNSNLTNVTTHNIESQQNAQCVKDNLQGPVKKLVISKELFFNLNKHVQKVRVIPEGVSNMTTKCSPDYSTTFLSVPGQNSNPSTLSLEKQNILHNKDFRTKSQAQSSLITSKKTRLSTASIPRRSYLKMLRDDLPKEKGSISLISNRNVSVKKCLKPKSPLSSLSQGTTVSPVFVTSTLRTASGPVTVKVRAPDPYDDAGASVDAKKVSVCKKIQSNPNTLQQTQSETKRNSHCSEIKISSLEKSQEGVSVLKLPASVSKDSGTYDSFVFLSPKENRPEESYSSDSDSDFLHDSEEQDLQVLGQLLQQDRKATSVAEISETCLTNSNFSLFLNDMGSNSALSSLPTKKIEPLIDATDKEYKTAHSCAKSNSSLKNTLVDFEKKTLFKIHESSDTEGLKIESVFSLNQASTSRAEITTNFDRGEHSTCAEPLTESDSKYSSLLHLNNNIAVSRWKNAVKTCFCVLERLSETDIERLISGSIDCQRESVSQCSEHCRKRILKIMCSLNLLPCKSKLFFTRSEEEHGKSINNPKPDQETDNDLRVVNQKQLLRKKLKIAQERLTEYLKSKSMLKSENATLTNISSKEDGHVITGTQMNSTEVPAAEKAPVLETKSVLHNHRTPTKSVIKGLNIQKKQARFQSLKNSSSQLSTFRQTMFKLRKQVEFRRKQMYRQKYETSKGLISAYPNVCAALSRKSCQLENRKAFGKRRKFRRGAAKLVSKKVLQLKCQGEIAKESVLSRLSQPIIAQLLPPSLVSTQVTPSSECNQTGITNGEGPKHNIKLTAKTRLPPALPERNIQQDFASAHTTQWSVKIAEALKSLHSYLKTTGRQLIGTETQHFLLRIGKQHVLVSVPPTEATLNDPTHNDKRVKLTTNAGAIASKSSPSFEAKCKDNVELPLAKTAEKRKAESLSSSSNPQAAGNCSESKTLRIGKTSLVTTDKSTTQSLSQRMVIHKNKTQIKQSASRYQTFKKLVIETEKDSRDHGNSNKQLKNNALSSAHQSHLLLSQRPTLSSSTQEKNSVPNRLSVITRNEVGSRTTASLNSSHEEKRTRIYADPCSILSHLPLDSSLLPIPRRNVQKRFAEGERASRRAMLEKKYPLPPGVIIKVELDRFSGAVDTCGTSELFHSSAVGKDGTMRLNSVVSNEGCEEQAIDDRDCNVVLALKCPSQCKKSFKSVLDKCTESEFEGKGELTNSVGTGSHPFTRYSPDGPPPLIAEAPTMTGSRKRPRKSRLVPLIDYSIPVNQYERPPILQPMCDPTPIIHPIQVSTSDEDICENPSASSLDMRESENLSKKQRLDSDSRLTTSASTSSNSPNSIGLAHTSNRGFRATEVSVSKNIRIQRLKELLKKKEQEIESIRKKQDRK